MKSILKVLLVTILINVYPSKESSSNDNILIFASSAIISSFFGFRLGSINAYNKYLSEMKLNIKDIKNNKDANSFFDRISNIYRIEHPTSPNKCIIIGTKCPGELKAILQINKEEIEKYLENKNYFSFGHDKPLFLYKESIYKEKESIYKE